MVKRDDERNRLLEAQVFMLSDEPLLGALVMSVDGGVIEVAINRNVAEALLEQLEDFLDGLAPTLDDLQRPEPANDG